MIFPNKLVSLDASTLGRISVILEYGPDPINIRDLFHKVENKFTDVDQFLLAIDLLYLLEMVDVDIVTRTLTYAD
jgi:hypothetical protein